MITLHRLLSWPTACPPGQPNLAFWIAGGLVVVAIAVAVAMLRPGD